MEEYIENEDLSRFSVAVLDEYIYEDKDLALKNLLRFARNNVHLKPDNK